ncbi:MAG TPA: hypothetical protein VI341_02965, partial [Actinomycetota bacterium]
MSGSGSGQSPSETLGSIVPFGEAIDGLTDDLSQGDVVLGRHAFQLRHLRLGELYLCTNQHEAMIALYAIMMVSTPVSALA